MLLAIFDNFTFRSRIQPALLTALPGALALLAWFPDRVIHWASLWALALWLGIAALMEELVREEGSRRQAQLWKSWGGAPTTHSLRYRAATDPSLLRYRHRKLERLLGDHFCLPNAGEEAADPAGADRRYEHALGVLRERTRGIRLVDAENLSYGFRRNLWALKPWGLLVGGAAFIAIGFALLLRPSTAERLWYGSFCLATTALLLLMWLLVVRPTWVRSAGERFARQLMASLDALSE